MLRGIRVHGPATGLVSLLISAFWSREFKAGSWLEEARFLVPQVAQTVMEIASYPSSCRLAHRCWCWSSR